MLASLSKLWPCVMALVAGSLQIRGIDGAVLHPFEPAGVANVLLFVATDCPISNSYAPEIQRICGAYAAKGISCSLIYEDAAASASDVRKHLDEHRYRGVPAAIDRDGSVAANVRASVTPQAVVVDRRGAIRYSGRIDNFYVDLGRPRQAVTSHDLVDALNALVDGRTVATSRTDAVGCYIVPANLRRK